MKARFIFLVLVCLLTVGWAEIIPSTHQVDWWRAGLTITKPARTNLIDVTQSPYGADPTGEADATSAIQGAINASASNDVVYLPTGRYRISTGLSLNRSYITLRGDGPTNSVLVGISSAASLLFVGHDALSEDAYRTYQVVGGATKGSTNLVLAAAVNGYGSPIEVGNMLTLSTATRNTGSPTFPIISVANYDRLISQMVFVSSVSGTNITLTAPLVWDMTNAPRLAESAPSSSPALVAVGVENLGITLTNAGETGSSIFQITASSLRDSWFSDLDLGWANNYQIYFAGLANCELTRSTIHDSLSVGSSHSGLILANAAWCRIEDNVFANGLFPGIEFNNGTMGCVFAFNYFTNTSLDIDCHNAHPVMNLFEGNILGNSIQMDGYFGSVSHQTLFRNRIPSTTSFKRWSSHMNVVGNVLGSTNYSYVMYREDSGYGSPWGIFEFGFPGMSNNSYEGTNPPVPWNYPGASYTHHAAGVLPTDVWTFTNAQGPTNILYGDFASVPNNNSYASLYPMFFRGSPPDTNSYYESVSPSGAGTSSNLTLTSTVTVSNGWTMVVGGPYGWQQLQSTDKNTHLLHGNLVYTNAAGTVVWDDAIADHAVPASLLYPSGSPVWWGTNRWPAIDPEAEVPVALIPAQLRFAGITSGESPPEEPSATPAGTATAGSVSVGMLVRP